METSSDLLFTKMDLKQSKQSVFQSATTKTKKRKIIIIKQKNQN